MATAWCWHLPRRRGTPQWSHWRKRSSTASFRSHMAGSQWLSGPICWQAKTRMASGRKTHWVSSSLKKEHHNWMFVKSSVGKFTCIYSCVPAWVMSVILPLIYSIYIIDGVSNKHTQVQTGKYTCSHAPTRTNTHTHAHTHVHTHEHTHTHARMHARTHTHSQTSTHTHKYTKLVQTIACNHSHTHLTISPPPSKSKPTFL